MSRNKSTNAILEANNGVHSVRALRKAHEILTSHDLRQPVLFHIVLTGSDSIPTYQKTIKALVRRLRTYGCRTEYFGAYEKDPLKQLHAHCFLLIETSKKQPFRKIMNIADGEYLHKLADLNGINRIHIAKPQNPMHDGQFFARPVGEKLADCLDWASYAFKSRSKSSVPSRETYFNSEFKANAVKREAELAALVTPKAEPAQQADEHPTNTHGEEEMNNKLTPAGFAYLGGLYEHCVDRSMNVVEIQSYLANKGAGRPLLQVKHDLDHVFGFHGYAAHHPAPPLQDHF